MTTYRGPQNLTIAPGYTHHREAVAAADTDFTDKVKGVNCAEHSVAHVQVVPSGGATVTVEVMWWSDAAGKFISENPALARSAAAVDTPFEFDAAPGGRVMLVAVTTIDAGAVDVYVGGHVVGA